MHKKKKITIIAYSLNPIIVMKSLTLIFALVLVSNFGFSQNCSSNFAKPEISATNYNLAKNLAKCEERPADALKRLNDYYDAPDVFNETNSDFVSRRDEQYPAYYYTIKFFIALTELREKLSKEGHTQEMVDTIRKNFCPEVRYNLLKAYNILSVWKGSKSNNLKTHEDLGVSLKSLQNDFFKYPYLQTQCPCQPTEIAFVKEYEEKKKPKKKR